MDIVLGAAENDIAEKYLPIAAEKGAVVVDNSSAFRLDEQVPLIIPEVNPQAVHEHHGIIANPNCATIIALVALQPLHAYANAKRMVAVSYTHLDVYKRQSLTCFTSPFCSKERASMTLSSTSGRIVLSTI